MVLIAAESRPTPSMCSGQSIVQPEAAVLQGQKVYRSEPISCALDGTHELLPQLTAVAEYGLWGLDPVISGLG